MSLNRVTAAGLLAMWLAVPSGALADFGSSKWGMTPAQVKKLFPGGKAEAQDSGGAIYRVETRALGIRNALVSFAFLPRRGLNLVVINVLGSRGPLGHPVDLEVGDFPRPSAKEVEPLLASLRKSLTSKYGKSDHERRWVGGGSVGWTGKGDYASLNTIPVDADRVEVQVMVRSSLEDLQTVEAQEVLYDVFARTRQEAWSTSSAMGVRWGMGAADVRDVFPKLRPRITNLPSDTTMAYVAADFVVRSVGIRFEFFRGRLVSLRFGPWMLPGMPPKETAEEEGMFAGDCEHWRATVMGLLREKYGPPFEGPTDEVAKEAERSQKRGLNHLTWRWRSGDTGIEVVRLNAIMQDLTYMDIGPLGREAFEAEQAKERATEDARKSRL